MKNALSLALAEQGYDTLTPVQLAVTDPALDDADLLVSAQTGSGKTVGFGLAIAPTLLGDSDAFGQAGTPLALVIAPTRELAMQVRRELAWLYGKAGVVMASCVGGMDMRDERRALERGAHIVVATPGRLRDHIMRGSIDLGSVLAVVLDEADEMLDLGFQEDLEFILGEAPDDRRTLMFSATVPRGIANLAGRYQRDAVRVTTAAETSQHADIDYRAMAVSARDADNAIINVLRFYEAPNALVFANTRAMVNRLTTRLGNRGFSVVALSGELSQAERTHALQAMRDGRARVCVATDVAARGIDLPNLDLVVHAELPTSHETMLHRSGRTGRAGRKGVSALIVPPVARKKCERLLRSAKINATWGEAPSADDVLARDEERMLADPIWQAEASQTDASAIAALLARFGPEQLATAYVTLYRERHTAPEDLSAADASDYKPRERAPFGPSRWFAVAGGRRTGAEPRRLLPMLCKAGGLSREDVGAIRIQDGDSLVELREAAVAGFLSTLGTRMEIEGAAVRPADAPGGSGPRPAPRAAPRAAPRKSPAQDAPDSAVPQAAAVFTDPTEATAPLMSEAPAPVARKPRTKAADKVTGPKPARDTEGAVTPYRPRDAGAPARPRSAPAGAGKPYKARTDGTKPYKPREDGAKPYRPREDGAKPARAKGDGAKPYAARAEGARTYKPRDESAKPYKPRDGAAKPYKPRDPGAKPYKPREAASDAAPAAPKRKKTLAELAGAPPAGRAGSPKFRERVKKMSKGKPQAAPTGRGGSAPPKKRPPKP